MPDLRKYPINFCEQNLEGDPSQVTVYWKTYLILETEEKF